MVRLPQRVAPTLRRLGRISDWYKGARIMPAPKTYHVKSFGCQMNVYDGERMGELLAADGLVAAPQSEADLVVLNTCHIRDRATHRVYSKIGALRREDGSKPMVALAGCV